MYWIWMQEHNKTALDASKHFNVNIEKVWEQINERHSSRDN